MIERLHIEQILKINGLSPTAKDEEIRSVLISAKWHEDEVETALTVLRENKTNHSTRIDTLHDVFLSDRKLSPEAIHNLLGIDIEVSMHDLENQRDSKKLVSFWQVMTIVFYATILAFGSIIVVMYVQNFGLFHPSLL
jgi:hypothetical protein